jgi:membrane protein
MARPSPWALGGLTLGELARRTWRKMWTDNVFDRAASLSFYCLLTIFPMLLFLTSLLGLLPGPRLMDYLMGYAAQVLPQDAASVIDKTLAEVIRGAGGGILSAGALGALWSASSGMASLQVALNIVYGIPERRSWPRRRVEAIALTLFFALFTLTALLLVVFGERIGEAVASWVGLGSQFTLAWSIVQWPAVIMTALTGIAAVYTLAPARRQPWHWLTPGATFALGAWLGASVGLRLYVQHVGDYNATYGSIGGVIILMLWLYGSAATMLVGAQINAVIEQAAADRLTVVPAHRPPAAETA